MHRAERAPSAPVLCLVGIHAGVMPPKSLHALCCDIVSDCVINLDNALDIMRFAEMHNIAKLTRRTRHFVSASWQGLVECNSHEALTAALGAELHATIAREHAQIRERVQRNRLLGQVVPPPLESSAFNPIGGASCRWTPQQSAPATPAQYLPPAQPGGSIGVIRSAPGSLARWDCPACTLYNPLSAEVCEACGGAKPAARSLAPASRPRARSFGGGGEKCAACAKTVYAAEKLGVHGKVFHQACFKCATCSTKLKVHNFEVDSDTGLLYCKVHFAQARSAKGGDAQYREPTVVAGVVAVASAGGEDEVAVTAGTPIGAAGPSTQLGSQAAPCRVRPTFELPRHPADPASGHTAATAPVTTPRRVVVVPTVQERCERCRGAVYANERMFAQTHAASTGRGEGHIFHRRCFRCADCNTLLRPDSWELDAGGVLLCKVHYTARLHAAATAQVEVM